MKKIWIDLDNSPHVPLFLPVIRELELRGYAVCLTARDAFQVCELADAAHLDYVRVGRHFGKNKLCKVVGLGLRTSQLLPFLLKEKPDLAVSHGSRAQLVASAFCRVPSLLMMDYEHARGLIFAGPAWVMVPESIPASAIPIAYERVLHYPGIKEDIYVPDFRPDPGMRSELGISEGEVLVTIRPPANEAHYHNPESETLFEAVLQMLSRRPDVRMVLLPRNHSQASDIRARWPQLFRSAKAIIPEHALNGLNLIWNSDLVISGGGTMNREAAALRVPVYSIFRGKIGAVDRYLASTGRLTLLESEKDLQQKLEVTRRKIDSTSLTHKADTLVAIVDQMTAIVEGHPRMHFTSKPQAKYQTAR